MIEFEWDDRQAQANEKKHGISFTEACSVFYDENAAQFYDEQHSDNEERFILLGISKQTRMLVVCHCEREQGHVIRIISARKAKKSESRYYKGGKDER